MTASGHPVRRVWLRGRAGKGAAAAPLADKAAESKGVLSLLDGLRGRWDALLMERTKLKAGNRDLADQNRVLTNQLADTTREPVRPNLLVAQLHVLVCLTKRFVREMWPCTTGGVDL